MKSNLKYSHPAQPVLRVVNGYQKESKSNDFLYKLVLSISLLSLMIYGLWEFSKALFS